MWVIHIDFALLALLLVSLLLALLLVLVLVVVVVSDDSEGQLVPSTVAEVASTESNHGGKQR